MDLSPERSCQSKKTYKTRERADKAADKLIKRGEDVHGYKCLHCEGYHVGHRKGSGIKATKPPIPVAAINCPTCTKRLGAPTACIDRGGSRGLA